MISVIVNLFRLTTVLKINFDKFHNRLNDFFLFKKTEADYCPYQGVRRLTQPWRLCIKFIEILSA